MYKAMKCAQAQACMLTGWLDLQSNPYAWVCLRIWPDNLILSVAAGGDVVWSSFSAGIFYHMERLENKQYIVHVQTGTPKVSYLAPPTAIFSCFYMQPWKASQLCITLLSHQTIRLLQELLEHKQYIYSMAPQKCHYIWILLQHVFWTLYQPCQTTQLAITLFSHENSDCASQL